MKLGLRSWLVRFSIAFFLIQSQGYASELQILKRFLSDYPSKNVLEFFLHLKEIHNLSGVNPQNYKLPVDTDSVDIDTFYRGKTRPQNPEEFYLVDGLLRNLIPVAAPRGLNANTGVSRYITYSNGGSLILAFNVPQFDEKVSHFPFFDPDKFQYDDKLEIFFFSEEKQKYQPILLNIKDRKDKSIEACKHCHGQSLPLPKVGQYPNWVGMIPFFSAQFGNNLESANNNFANSSEQPEVSCRIHKKLLKLTVEEGNFLSLYTPNPEPSLAHLDHRLSNLNQIVVRNTLKQLKELFLNSANESLRRTFYDVFSVSRHTYTIEMFEYLQKRYWPKAVLEFLSRKLQLEQSTVSYCEDLKARMQNLGVVPLIRIPVCTAHSFNFDQPFFYGLLHSAGIEAKIIDDISLDIEGIELFEAPKKPTSRKSVRIFSDGEKSFGTLSVLVKKQDVPQPTQIEKIRQVNWQDVTKENLYLCVAAYVVEDKTYEKICSEKFKIEQWLFFDAPQIAKRNKIKLSEIEEAEVDFFAVESYKGVDCSLRPIVPTPLREC